MKCPKCGRLWNVSTKITSSTYVCPYCGEIVDGYGQSKTNLGEIIIRIKDDFGEEIIDDTTRLNALLMDYAPNMAKERKVVINALKEGILNQLRRGIEEHEDADIVSRRCVALLVSEMWITEAAAQYAVNVVMHFLGQPMITSGQESDVANIVNEKQLIKGTVSFGEIIRKEDLKEYDSIGYKAFALNKKLAEVHIPETICCIYPKAFMDCAALKLISFNKGIEYIGRGVFDGCTNLETIITKDNPDYTVSNGMLIDKREKKLIRSTNKGNDPVSIVNGIKIICKKAFEGALIERIRIPGTVEVIEEDAFFLTMSLQDISVDGVNRVFRSYDGVLHSRDGKELLRYPQGKRNSAYYLEDEVIKIGKKAFSCAVKLLAITFTGNLKEIGENAFEYCMGLENILLPRSVEIVGERAFQYCRNMISVMLPYGIIRIGDCAFLGCESLKTVSIPGSVKEIGNMAFYGCQALSKVVIQENVKFIGDKVFNDCPDIEIAVKGNEYVMTYCKVHGIRCTMT